MSYSIHVFAGEETTQHELTAAVSRFKTALEEALGDGALVLPVHAAYARILAVHGETPSEEALSPGEWAVFTQWQVAEAAALDAALGPHRYLGEAQFEIRPSPGSTASV